MRVQLDVHPETTIHDLIRVGDIVPTKPSGATTDHNAWICTYRGKRYVVFASHPAVAGDLLLHHLGVIREGPDGSMPGCMWEIQFNGFVVWHGSHSVTVEHNPAEVVKPEGES